MSKEERQRERKRRRRQSQEGAGEDVAGTVAADEGATAEREGSAAEVRSSAAPDHPSPEHPSFEWEEDEPSTQHAAPEDIPPPPAGPVATAQILSAPSSARRTDEGRSDSFFTQGRAEPDDEIPEPESAHPDDTYDPNAQLAEPYSYQRESTWTREPVLLALLLVALIVVAFNTYFTLRLNGISDRLAAAAAKPATTAATMAERPWVGVDSIRTAQFANGGQPVTTVHIVNSGREPAYDLRSNTVGSLRSSATPAPQVPAQKGPLATTGLLLPNTGGNLTFFANTRALTAEEAASVRSGKFVLWLAGRLDYKDSKGHVHLTSFRYRYNPQLNSFIAAPDGNRAN